MSENSKPGNANSKKVETGVKSFIDNIKNRFGIVQHSREITPDPKRLEALLSEIEVEIRNDQSEIQAKAYTTYPQPIEDTSMQQKWANDELKVVNLAIERKYEELRSTALDNREEELCVESIRKLEMRRLNLMAKLHGQDLNGYAAVR